MFQLDELLKIASYKEALNNINALKSGLRIGSTPYVIQKTLYRGDESFTYLASNDITDQQVVVKEYFPMGVFEYDGQMMKLKRENHDVILSESTDENLRLFHILKTKFNENAMSLMKLKYHRNVVSPIEVFSANGTQYVVLEYLPYPTLNVLLKDKLLKPRQAIALYMQILEAVRQIHKKGYLHLSLKPSNIYISDQHVILGDFQMVEYDEYYTHQHASLYNDFFSAPEVKQHVKCYQSSDVFALSKILAYLMEHIGYREGSEQHLSMGYQFEPSRIDYIIRAGTEDDPIKRIQNVDQILESFKHKIVNKDSRMEWFKWVIATFLVMIAVFAFTRIDVNGLLKQEQKVDVPNVIISDMAKSFEFVSTRKSFDYDKDIVIKWQDIEIGYYNIEILKADYPCCQFKIAVSDNQINLTDLALNPGTYTLILKKPSLETISYEFEVVGESILAQPVFKFERYEYYTGEAKPLEWSTLTDGFYRLKILNLSNRTSEDISLEQKSIDLDMLGLEIGQYFISVQTHSGEDVSFYDHVYVNIYEDDAVKCPILITKNHTEMTSEGFIEWLPVEGTVQIKLVHQETFNIVEASFEAGMDNMSLSEHALESGSYDLYISHLKTNKSSKVLMNEITILAQ